MSFTAKSFILDAADNHGSTARIGIRSLEFIDEFGAVVALVSTVPDFSAKATTNTSTARWIFDTTKSKIGSGTDVSWVSPDGTVSSQRISVVFTSEITFSGIRTNNYHSYGGSTNRGINNAKMYISDASITSVVFDADTANYELIFDGVIPEHVATNVADDQDLTLIEYVPPYPVDILTGPPVLGAPFAYDPAAFVVVGILTGAPVLGAPVGYGVGFPLDILTGPPVLGTPAGHVVGFPIGILTGAPVLGTPAGEYVEFYPSLAHLKYICTLTGDPDIDIPISSFQGRLRSGEDTYLSVIIPGLDYAGDIADRSDGQIVIYAAYLVDGVPRKSAELIRVNMGGPDNIRIDSGPLNKTITLTGYRQETYTPKNVTLENPVYWSLSNGQLRYRLAEPDLSLNPGDVVTVGGDTFTAAVVAYYVSASAGTVSTTMEVSEE